VSEKREAFRELDHTADLGIEVKAATLPLLFASAGEAFFGLIVDPTGVEPKKEITVSAEGEDKEELLHAWLSELLAQFNLNGFVGKRCEVVEVEAGKVESRVKGEKLDLKRHRFYTEIKGVTYHELKVWQENGQWHARVIFDV
jgi:SHS2 domain-containing protein